MKRLAILSVIVCALLLVQQSVVKAGYTKDKTKAAALDKEAPGFTLADADGNERSLKDFKGKYVVLEWTNPDCPYVARHYDADTMEKLANQLGADGVVWFAVNSTHYNKPEDTRAWKEAQGLEYATLQDPEGTLGHLLGARTTPHMFVIDGEGVLRYEGAIDDDPRGRSDSPTNYVSGGVQALLAGNAPDPSQTRAYGCSVKYAGS